MMQSATPPARVPGLTVVLPTMRECDNLAMLFRQIHAALDDQVDQLEILVVDTPTGDGTEELCRQHGVRYIGDPAMGFADALRTGFKAASHDLLVTMDADGSHDPGYIRWMLPEIDHADLVIASRYVPQGGQETTLFRYVTSRVLNFYLGTVCSLPIRDLSGGFKLYRKSIFKHLELESRGFEIQAEIAIRAYGHGFKLREIPFCYHPRVAGRSKAAIIKYGMAFLIRSLKLRRFRNSILYCDYYERAFRSRIPPQRLWHRRKYDTTLEMLPPPSTGKALDVGCGTGRITMAFKNVVSLDTNPKVLRYLSHFERKLVRGNALNLPFRDNSFDVIYCSEVIEHLPPFATVFRELSRVLKPGGRTLIVTADYGGPVWPMIYRLYRLVIAPEGSYVHIANYTRDSLRHAAEAQGLRHIETRSMYNSLIFMLFEKPASPPPSA